MTENEETILEYLSYRGMALPRNIQVACNRSQSQTHALLKRMIKKGWLVKPELSFVSTMGLKAVFYQITESGYFELSGQFGNKRLFDESFPSEFKHKTHIDYVIALLFRYGYRPFGLNRQEMQANIKARTRLPDALMKSKGGKVLAIEVEVTTKKSFRYERIIRSYATLIKKGYISGVVYLRESERGAKALQQVLERKIKSVYMLGAVEEIKMRTIWHHFMFLGIDVLANRLAEEMG